MPRVYLEAGRVANRVDEQAIARREFRLRLKQPEELRDTHKAGMTGYMKTGRKTADWVARETLGLRSRIDDDIRGLSPASAPSEPQDQESSSLA